MIIEQIIWATLMFQLQFLHLTQYQAVVISKFENIYFRKYYQYENYGVLILKLRELERNYEHKFEKKTNRKK